MPELSALDSLAVRFDSETWICLDGDDGDPLITAVGSAIVFHPTFARSQNLPSQITPDQIQMVVAGWAEEDQTWHLGVLLEPDLSAQRGGRWCGFARWAESGGGDAESAGRALGGLLVRPFRLVAPTLPAEEPPSEPEVEAEPIALLPLPLDLGEWELVEDAVGLLCKESGTWRRSMLTRMLILGGLAPIFGYLSVGAITSVYASVQPEWLPYLGLIITAVLIFLAGTQAIALLRGVHAVIDQRSRMVRRLTRNGQVLVQTPFEGVEYVLATQVINRRQEESGARKGNTPIPFSAEVWIHVYSPRRGFILLSHSSDLSGIIMPEITLGQKHPLNLEEVNTPAHHAALHVAEMIGVPAYLDQR